MKGLTSIILALIILALCFSTAFADVRDETEVVRSVTKDEAEVVRVGWYPIEKLEELDAKGNPSGYGRDVLETLSRYTGFTFEYDCGTFEECYEKLQNGDIDLMLFMKYTPQREEYVDYCSYPLFKISTYATCLTENADDYYGPESFNGKTVALETGAVQGDELDSFLGSGDISYTPLYCADSSEVKKAVDEGRADFAVIPSVIPISEKQTAVESFSQRYTCITLNKNREGLLDRVDQGMSAVISTDPDYFDNLYETYFGDPTSRTFFLTNEEKAAVEQLGTLRFFINTENGYLARLENGEYKGIRVDVVKAVAEKLGMSYEFVPINSIDELLFWQDSDKADFIGGAYFNYELAEERGYQITSPFLTYKYYCIRNKNYTGTQEDATVAALLPGDCFTDSLIVPNFSEDKIVRTENTLECLKRVNSGDADITYLSSYMAEYYMQSYEYNNVTSSITDYSTQVCIAGNMGIDPLVFSALNKAIGSITDTEMETIVLQNTAANKTSLTMLGAVNKYPLEFIAVLAVVLAVTVAAVLLIIFNRKLNANNQKLVQANAAKGEFLSRMSHDIRTPLNAVLGFAELAQDEPDISPQVSEYLEGIDESGKYLLGLINDVLDMSKIEASKLKLSPEPYSFEDFENSIFAIVASRAKEKGVSFIIHNEVTAGETVLLDKLRIRQVFINLLNNAVKFTPEGGEVEFRITSGQPTEDGRLPLTFTVRDTGIGMSEDFMKTKLFQSFEQENSEKNQTNTGTGLGLTIAKQLVELMDGTIECKSRQGVGTTFTVCLSPALAEKPELAEPTTAILRGRLKGAHILLCEDNHTNAIIAERLLEKVGCIVNAVENGKLGVESFAASAPGAYSAILMDIRMPEMDGLKATRAIRALDRPDARKIPIIAMSANALSEDVRESLSAGMNAHLSKPIEPNKLYSVLAEQLERRKNGK